MNTHESKKVDPAKLNVVLATDCGSTTTKAVLFEKLNGAWRQTYRGEAPTTVEKPVADVTIGAQNAFREVEELSQRKLLCSQGDPTTGNPIYFPEDTRKDGVDLYVSTSSAGGGLQMIVAGVVGTMTAQSAERAALGAGAIVMDTISLDDGRESYERVKRIRHLRPDIILIAGGTEGGTLDHPLELAETILQADPRPRFGETIKLPVIYAANSHAAPQAKQILEHRFAFEQVHNIRPSLEKENLAPARDAIHELFLHHVMSHAPGYKKLLQWSPVPILPTPAAVGEMVQRAAADFGMQILAVDIGGATTDVFSVFKVGDDERVFNRTVSANLGMSYSVANVLLEAGVEAIAQWLPFFLSERDLRDRLRNKMIRPTSIPQTLEDLHLEQAVCREALRLAFVHHKRLAVGLSGLKQQRTIGDMFRQSKGQSLIDMLGLDLIIGSGGVLSHAPNRASAALMIIDAFEPEGITELAVDSIFMMPHLGVFSSVYPQAAAEIFLRDCLVPLGTVISPRGPFKIGEPCMSLRLEGEKDIVVPWGEFRRIDLGPNEKRKMEIVPLRKNINIGGGSGIAVNREVRGGHVGIILDARGRPMRMPDNSLERQKLLGKWLEVMGLAERSG